MAVPLAAFASLREVRPGRELFIRLTPGSTSGTFNKLDLGVLLVHGNQGSHRQYQKQQSFLEGLGFATLEYDLLGCGFSKAPWPSDKAALIACYCPASNYADLEAILQLFIQSVAGVIVCGHSLGGPLAAELAKQHPSEVVGLIMLGCRSYPQSDAQRASMQRLQTLQSFAPRLYRACDLASPLLQPFIAIWLIQRFWHHLTFWRKPWLPLKSWLDFCFARPWVLQALFSSPPFVSASWKGYVDLFKSIKQPTLLIDGEQDMTGATGVQRIAADLADSCSFNLAEAAHYPHMERPETVNQLMLNWVTDRVIRMRMTCELAFASAKPPHGQQQTVQIC